ncbi:nucleotidyltransferase family protein [Thalassotalea ganghwensis]
MLDTLVILAAGNGSRYGSPKQFALFGPKQQPLWFYNIELAYQAGYRKVILVCQRKHQQVIEQLIHQVTDNQSTFEQGLLNIAIVYQDPSDLPSSCKSITETAKPLGTAHALWCCRHHLKHPFTVINGDDFYGQAAFQLSRDKYKAQPNNHYLIAYPVSKTLSVYGGVNRGLCQLDQDLHLTNIVEITDISAQNKQISGVNHAGDLVIFSDKDLVSMNFWTFNVSIFSAIETLLSEQFSMLGGENAECYLPEAAKRLITLEGNTIEVVASHDLWFGVTYAADRQTVDQHLALLFEKGLFAN